MDSSILGLDLLREWEHTKAMRRPGKMTEPGKGVQKRGRKCAKRVCYNDGTLQAKKKKRQTNGWMAGWLDGDGWASI